MENLGYLLAAFIFIWVVLFGYLFLLNGRLRRLTREIDSLQKASKQDSAPR